MRQLKLFEGDEMALEVERPNVTEGGAQRRESAGVHSPLKTSKTALSLTTRENAL